MMVQCVVHHELDSENMPLTFHIPVSTLCQEFIDEISFLLACSPEKLFIYHDQHSLFNSVDKVQAFSRTFC